MPARIDLSEEQVIADYLSGQYTHRELAQRYGVTKMPIQRILRNHGIAAIRPACRRYTYVCDETFFDVIDTEEKAYWLGFLAADGCVVDRGKKGLSVILCLSSSDEEHIRRFRDALHASHLIARYKQKRLGTVSVFSRITIWGPRLPQGLAAHGVTPRKTFTHGWPELEGEMLRHYLRGYVDGDGHVGPGRLQVAGTTQFLGEFQRYLRSVGAKGGTIVYPKGPESIAILAYGGNRQVETIHNHLYNGATIALPRKAGVNQLRPIARWAENYDCCTHCGTTERRHNAKGLCRRCYSRQGKSSDTFRPTLTGRWATKYDGCVICGNTDNPHHGHGRCYRCWYRERHPLQPRYEWSPRYPRCQECSQTVSPHIGHGLCRCCFLRRWRRKQKQQREATQSSLPLKLVE